MASKAVKEWDGVARPYGRERAKPGTILKCKICGYEWNPTVAHPGHCARCLSPRWETGRWRTLIRNKAAAECGGDPEAT